MKEIIPIFYACDDNFVKYTIVSLKSLIENANNNYQYKIYILITNISNEMAMNVKELERENVDIEFVNVISYLNEINKTLPIRDYYSKTTYYRLFIATMFPQYDKVIYIDSDTIVLKDISKLYNHNLKNNFVGACHEQAMLQTEVFGNYVEQVLGISRNNYFNAGLLLINCKQFRENNILLKFTKLLKEYTFVVTQDEDYLNILCQNRVLWLDDSWNVEVYGNINVKEEDINIIHFIMVSKPWHYSNCRLQDYFWKYAKETKVYQLILNELNSYTNKQKENDELSAKRLVETAIFEANKEDSYYKMKIKNKDFNRVNIVNKIKEYEAEGRFDEDVENDPPTKELLPNKVDYLRKSIYSKVKTKLAYFMARKFLNNIIENKKMIVKEIKGIENFNALSSGAIITCNHFNAFDSFAIQMAYEASKHKDRTFYRVIREGNYTSFPGFYGFLMKNCYTLPLSSNTQTMKKFIKSTNLLLQEGNFVLFYPEQSMWWNYRKPKPLKEGAYRFASNNNVPVLPCFITMNDSNIKGDDGYLIQEYTIHIGKPIYPCKDKSLKENINYLKNENYKVWKKIYENSYKTKLIYDCNEDILLNV